MNAFGVEVHLVELMEHILPLEDNETASGLKKSFSKKGIDILTNTRAVSIEKSSNKVSVTLLENNVNEKVIDADKALVVVGRTPNSDGIGLESIGIETENGFIKVGDYYQTSVDGVFAVGDAINSPLLAHVASKEGEIAVEYIAGQKPEPRIDLNSIPSAVYTEPQIGSFGITENKALKSGIKYNKAVFPYRGNGKAVALDNYEGMAKVLFDPVTKKILGAHIIGQNATELIHEILLAKTAKLSSREVGNMIHAHPTLSELVMEVMKAVEGNAIHI